MKYNYNEKVMLPDSSIGIVKDYMDRSKCYRVYFEEEKISLWFTEDSLKAVDGPKQYTLEDYLGVEKNENKI